MMRLILLSALTLFIFSGCQEKIVYVDRPCPKLHTIKVKEPHAIKYTVREKSENIR